MFQEPQFFWYGIIEFIINIMKFQDPGTLSKPVFHGKVIFCPGLFVAPVAPLGEFDAGPWILLPWILTGSASGCVGFLSFPTLEISQKPWFFALPGKDLNRGCNPKMRVN